MCKDLIEHLAVIRDPRAEKGRLYRLEEILLLCICAVVSGMDSWAQIALFGREKLPWLRQFLPYANGTPSADCLGWLMARLPAPAFTQCFIAWTRAVAQLSDGEVVALDGKTLRGSHDRHLGQSAIHMVGAWASAQQLSLGQVACAAKSNEITAIPALLELLALKGCIVSIDAMGCQREIAGAIIAQGADYVLAVKDNQPQLHEAIRDYFDTARAANFAHVPVAFHEATEAGHGRVEVRRCWLVEDLRTLPAPAQWPGLRSIALVEAERHHGGRTTRESRYYISSLPGDHADVVARAVRAHWGIENRLHWCLDMTFREDDSRVRRNHAPANFATVRRFAVNLIKRQQGKLTIKAIRTRAGLSDAFRAKLLFGEP